jgi:hypothetical protein
MEHRKLKRKMRIGAGTYGTVFLAQHTLDGVALGLYAVKKIPVGDDHVRTHCQWAVGGERECSTIDGVALGLYAVKKIPVRDDHVRTHCQWAVGGERECSGVR